MMDWLTGPNFRIVKKSVTDVSAISLDMLVIAFRFSPLKHSLLLLQSFGYVAGNLPISYRYLTVDLPAMTVTGNFKNTRNH